MPDAVDEDGGVGGTGGTPGGGGVGGTGGTSGVGGVGDTGDTPGGGGVSVPDWVGEPPDNIFEMCRLPGCFGPESIKFDGRPYIRIGRAGEMDVKLDANSFCSRKHAVLGFDPAKGRVYLMDLGSAHA